MEPGKTAMIGNRYKILTTESSGRLAISYGAVDLFTGNTVEVTSISKRRANAVDARYSLSRLRADAAFCLKIVHPGLLHAHDQLDDEDFIHLVSEYSGLRPISELGPTHSGPDAMSFIGAMQKVIYAVEFYHSHSRPGCFIRPQHVRLSLAGDVQIDHFVDCRLSFLSEAGENKARLVMKSDEEAALLDIYCAGEVLAVLLREMPKSGGLNPAEAAVIRDALPAIADISDKMCRGNFASITQVSAAMHAVEDRMRAGLREGVRAFPPKSRRRKLAAGEVLFREGDHANGEAFVIERGLFQISKTGPNGREIYLDVSKPGDIIGEMALINRQPRMATARALEPSTLVVITNVEFDRALNKMDTVSRRLVDTLTARLRFQINEVTRLKSLIGVGK